MDWQQVLQQVTDLPATFLRSGATFTQWMASFTEEVARYTETSDTLTNQINFNQSVGPWLDTWGRLFGIPRYTNESDAAYSTRITQTLQAYHGPPLAIEAYLEISLGLQSTVYENFPNVGWQIQLGPTAAKGNLATIAQDLNFVRPAGVPYYFEILQGGCYLTTVNYLDRPKVTGAYLTLPFIDEYPDIPANTNNAIPLLPTNFLTDPVINPSLA